MPTGDSGKPPHTFSCETHAEADLSARRRHARSFVLEPVDPASLPAAEFGGDGRVRREPLLKALVVQTTSQVERDFGPDAIDRVITKVGSDGPGRDFRVQAGLAYRRAGHLEVVRCGSFEKGVIEDVDPKDA